MKTVEEMTDKEYAAHMIDNFRSSLQKIEAIKNFIRDGKQVVAYEKLQGVGDALAFMMGGAQKRLKTLEGNQQAS